MRPDTVHVSATPGPWEMDRSGGVFTETGHPPHHGLIDPPVEEVKPVAAGGFSQVDDVIDQVRQVAKAGYRSLITVLTKKMAEDLTEYMHEQGLRVRYMHSDVDTLERIEIIRDLRLGAFDALVGINLLREGPDIPECGLVAILDADKEGFLRSETSLIQTIGRAARNVDGRVILYADHITGSMERAMAETKRRREKQEEWNAANGITPESVKSQIKDILSSHYERDHVTVSAGVAEAGKAFMGDNFKTTLKDLEGRMRAAASNLEFEEAARLRDEIKRLESCWTWSSPTTRSAARAKAATARRGEAHQGRSQGRGRRTLSEGPPGPAALASVFRRPLAIRRRERCSSGVRGSAYVSFAAAGPWATSSPPDGRSDSSISRTDPDDLCACSAPAAACCWLPSPGGFPGLSGRIARSGSVGLQASAQAGPGPASVDPSHGVAGGTGARQDMTTSAMAAQTGGTDTVTAQGQISANWASAEAGTLNISNYGWTIAANDPSIHVVAPSLNAGFDGPFDWSYQFTATSTGTFDLHIDMIGTGDDLEGLGSWDLNFADGDTATETELLRGYFDAPTGEITTDFSHALVSGHTYTVGLCNIDGFSASGITTSASVAAQESGLVFWNISGGVPEPSTWALTIAGFGLAGAALRRRGGAGPSERHER